MVNMMTYGALNATMIGTVIMGLISFALTIYNLYLNRQQAKVSRQMDELISVLKEIRDKKQMED